MAQSPERQSLAKVLVHEGGYVNHPADPGGPINHGVTQRVHDGYRKGTGLPVRSVKHITVEEVQNIYDRQYWDAVKGDLLPDGVDYVVFDGGVRGPSARSCGLKQALRPTYKGPIDGVMVIETIAAPKAVNDNDALIDRICDAHMSFLRHLSTFRTDISMPMAFMTLPECRKQRSMIDISYSADVINADDLADTVGCSKS